MIFIGTSRERYDDVLEYNLFLCHPVKCIEIRQPPIPFDTIMQVAVAVVMEAVGAVGAIAVVVVVVAVVVVVVVVVIVVASSSAAAVCL